MVKINEFLASIDLSMEAIINWAIIVGALIFALFFAKIIAWLVWKWVRKAGFVKSTFEKIGVNIDLDKVWKIVSKIVYFLLIFTIFIWILNYAKLDTAELPLIGSLKEFVDMLISAGLVAFIAWLLASIAKITILKIFKSNDFDKKLSENIQTQWNISESVWIIAYWVIILFFLPKVLTILKFDDISEQIESILRSITGYIDDLFAAALIIVIFFFAWKIISKLIWEFLSKVGFDKVLGLIWLQNVESKTKPSLVIWNLVFAFILLFAVTEASETLGLGSISTMINEIIAFSTNIILWVVILAIGMYLGNLASNAIKSATSSKILPIVAKFGIIILTTFMALQQMQIGGDIVNQAFTLILGSLAVAFALAVWLGSKEVAWEEVKKLIENMKK